MNMDNIGTSSGGGRNMTTRQSRRSTTTQQNNLIPKSKQREEDKSGKVKSSNEIKSKKQSMPGSKKRTPAPPSWPFKDGPTKKGKLNKGDKSSSRTNNSKTITAKQQSDGVSQLQVEEYLSQGSLSNLQMYEFSPHSEMGITNTPGLSMVEIRGSDHKIPPSWKGRISEKRTMILANLHHKVLVVVNDIDVFDPNGYYDKLDDFKDYANHNDPDEMRRFTVYIESKGNYQRITCLMNSDIDILVEELGIGKGMMMKIDELLDDSMPLSPEVTIVKHIQVLGCGTAEVNGTYTITNKLNEGCPIYRKKGQYEGNTVDYILFCRSYGAAKYWNISIAGKAIFFYRSANGVRSNGSFLPPMVSSGWVVKDEGQSPTPDLVYLSSASEGSECIVKDYNQFEFECSVKEVLTSDGADILQFLFNIEGVRTQHTQTQKSQTQETQGEGLKPAAIPPVGIGAPKDDEEEGEKAEEDKKPAAVNVDNNEEMEDTAAAAAGEDEEEIVETPIQPDNISTNVHMCTQCLKLTEEEGKECKDGCSSSFCPECAVTCLDKDDSCFQCSDKFEETTKYELDRERAKNVEAVGLNRLIPNNITELATGLSSKGKKGLELLFGKVNGIAESMLKVSQNTLTITQSDLRPQSVYQQLETVVLLLMIGNVLRRRSMSIERVKDLLRQHFRASVAVHDGATLYKNVQNMIKEICNALDPNESRCTFGIEPQSDGVAKGRMTCKDTKNRTIDFSQGTTRIPTFFESFLNGGKPEHDVDLQIDPTVKVIILIEKADFVEHLDRDCTTVAKSQQAQEAGNERGIWISGRGGHSMASLGFIVAVNEAASQMASPPKVVTCGDMNLSGYRIMDRVYVKCKVSFDLLLLYQGMCNRHQITIDEPLDDKQKKELKEFIEKSKWLRESPSDKEKVAAMRGNVNMERLGDGENDHDMIRIVLDELKLQFRINLYV